jgi:hypothetical protein
LIDQTPPPKAVSALCAGDAFGRPLGYRRFLDAIAAKMGRY